MKRALCLAGLALLLLPASAVADRERPPAVLLFHGGGFSFGAAVQMEEAAAKAERRGFIARSVEYPLCDIGAAVKTAVAASRELRRRGYRVFAYGDSAGGTLAALLAEGGLARAAVADAPPSDLIHWPGFFASDEDYQAWLGLDLAGRFRLSPAFHPSQRRILVMQGDDEFKAPNRAWASRDPLVRYEAIPGSHLSYPEYHANTALGMSWLRRQAALSRPPPGDRAAR
jgi:acetyl esterase/lipase